LYILLFFVYFTLTSVKLRRTRLIFSAIFILLSLLLNQILDHELFRDYATYYRVLTDKGYKPVSFSDFIYEPYLMLISKLLLKYFSIGSVLFFYYLILFLLSTLFFCWIAFLEDISPWKKNIFFGLFHILFTFLLIRNGIALMILAVFFYLQSKSTKTYFQLSSLFFHLTTFPVLLFSIFNKKKITYFIIPIIIFITISLFFLLNDPASILNQKFRDFQKNSIYYNYPFHYSVFVLTISIFIFFWVYFKKILNNYFYVLMILLYVLLFYFNVVMGFRFSFYIFIFLLIDKNLHFSDPIEKYLNRYSLFMFVFSILSFRLFLF